MSSQNKNAAKQRTANSPGSHTPKKKKKKMRLRTSRVAALLVLAAILVLAGFWFVRMQNPLKLKGALYQTQIKRDLDPYGNIDSLFMDSKNNVVFNGNVDTQTAGNYEVSYTYKGKEYPFTIQVADIEAPVLEVQDRKTDLVETVTAESFITSIQDDSPYSTKVEGAGTDEGSYTVTITAVDSNGNQSKKKASLVRVKDSTPPEIVNFETDTTMLQGRIYHAKNYELKDDLDPNPVVSIDTSQLNADIPGVYTVSYNVSDRSGNTKTFQQNVTVQEDPDFGKKVVYLTFDDGPSENTIKILDILKKNNVTATFFVTGTNPDYNSVMKDIVDSGNTIALHTYSHNYGQLYASDEAYFQDLQAISDLVEQQTGVKANVIRFPGGSSNMVSSETSQGIMSRLVDEVHDKGYEYFDWNVDSTDASGNGVPAATLVANAKSGIGMDRAVILFHDAAAKSTTVEALPAVIKAYQDAGYVFRGLTVDSFPVHHHVNN